MSYKTPDEIKRLGDPERVIELIKDVYPALIPRSKILEEEKQIAPVDCTENHVIKIVSDDQIDSSQICPKCKCSMIFQKGELEI